MSLSCPVCFEIFSSSSGASFALHVNSCSSSSLSLSFPSLSSSSILYCSRCYHVYAATTLPHEMSFHEHECARMNITINSNTNSNINNTSTATTMTDNTVEYKNDTMIVDTTIVSTESKVKRQRHELVHEVVSPRVSLFPSNCFLCGNTGRGLLRCYGTCARSVHQYCIDQIEASIEGDLLSLDKRKQAIEEWKCAHCWRNIHSCQYCGFLGHKDNGMRKCRVVNCGYYFHKHCQPNLAIPDQMDKHTLMQSDFVCPRHTCNTCGIKETDMKRCKSCCLCLHMTHLRCPRESGTVSAVPAIKSSEVDPIHLFYCSQHDGKTAKCPTSSSDASNSLRLRLAAGDVVLVLEFNNALLPQSAKMVAPDAANLWGVVVSAEEMEPRGRGNQLLKVRMFADDNVLAVPNQYAVRIAAASDFSRPVDLIRHCLQRHAMVELQLRRTDGKIDDVEAKRILFVSYKSFAARLKALRVTAAQALSYAEEGLARWRRFHDLAEPHHYDGLGDSAPIYFYIDTRGSRFGQQVLNSMDTVDNVAEAVRDVNEDVSVTGADTDSGGAAANGLARGSPHLHRRPYSVGRSPHEAEAEQLMKADAILSDTHLTHCSLPKQSQNSTQHTSLIDAYSA